jgi:hypothetical protein
MVANDVTLRLKGSEYEQLLKTVYLGNWLLTSRQPEGDRDSEKLESKLFSYASSAGLGKYADYDQETEMFYPADALHELSEINEAISDYDDETCLCPECTAKFAAGAPAGLKTPNSHPAAKIEGSSRETPPETGY